MAKPDLGAIIAQTMAPTDEARSIEVITRDILDAQRTGGEAILTIGRCLIEAKDRLPRGEWLPWLSDQVGYSERTAQNFMRLAREFSNPQALADLGATKALALLALPPDEREQFVAENNVVDMTSRQLEQAIRERDEARAAAERAAAEQRTAEEARAKMEEDMRLLNARLAGSKDDWERAMQDVSRLEAELEELKAKPVDVAVETVVDQEAIDRARDEVRAELKEKLKIARSQRREAEDALAAVREQLDRLRREEKRAELSSDKDVAQFEVLFNQGQELAQKMKGYLLKARGRENGEVAQGMEKAMLALSDLIRGCAE